MKFTPQDFVTQRKYHGDREFWSEVCDVANARLEQMLKDAPVVYGRTKMSPTPSGFIPIHWYSVIELDDSPDTHKAKLVCIEPLKGEGVGG